MHYDAEKLAILAETDFRKLRDRTMHYADLAADAAGRNDTDAMHTAIRLGHWVEFRRADFKFEPLGLPIVDEHVHEIVGDMIEAFAAAIETDPPPMTFDEALALAGASRGN